MGRRGSPPACAHRAKKRNTRGSGTREPKKGDTRGGGSGGSTGGKRGGGSTGKKGGRERGSRARARAREGCARHGHGRRRRCRAPHRRNEDCSYGASRTYVRIAHSRADRSARRIGVHRSEWRLQL
eukprot:6175039-Pleurochrysis_carterae.AAC.2